MIESESTVPTVAASPSCIALRTLTRDEIPSGKASRRRKVLAIKMASPFHTSMTSSKSVKFTIAGTRSPETP